MKFVFYVYFLKQKGIFNLFIYHNIPVVLNNFFYLSMDFMKE